MDKIVDQDWPAEHYVSIAEYHEHVQNYELYIDGLWRTLDQVSDWLKIFIYGEQNDR